LMLLLDISKPNVSNVLKRLSDILCREIGIEESSLQLEFQSV
jgi:hypothetical protein